MELPVNRFKAALKAGRQQIGIWNTLGGNTVPELLAGAGFDWMVIDTEHSPVELVDILPALQAAAAYPHTATVVRPAANDTVLIKRALDLGAQTLMLPYVQSANEARAAVSAMRYAPEGVRGMAGTTRASRYGAVKDYALRASEDLCLIVQVETRTALHQLEEIAGVDGVDAVFIGPADLAASLGHRGQLGHPDVIAAVEDAIRRSVAVGCPVGILTLDRAFARRCIALGTTFTAVGLDLALLAGAARGLAAEFRESV